MRFRALKTFECEEVRSTYVTGLTYTVREGNEILAGLVEDWIKQGRVEIVDNSVKARVAGSGRVI